MLEEIYVEPPHYPDIKQGIYKEITSWKNYELKNNIAYEMAIRNKSNMRSLQEYRSLLYKSILPSTNLEQEIIELLKFNKTILLAYEKHGDNIYFKSFDNHYNEQIATSFSQILSHLEQQGFTIEAINFHSSMSLISQIQIFKELSHIQIYYKLQDINSKYYELNTYFIFQLGSLEVTSSISSRYIEDDRNRIYNVKLEDDGLYAYERKWENHKLHLLKYSQINPGTRFRSEIGLKYKLLMARPLMKRPYRHSHISISLNINKPVETLKEEVEYIVQSLIDEKKIKFDEEKKSQYELNEKMLKLELMSPKQKTLCKLKYIMNQYTPSNSTNTDLHHVVAIEIDRPKNSNTKDNHEFFIEGLYIYDCYELWKSNRMELKKYYKGKKFKDEEIPYKNFIDELYRKISVKKVPSGDHRAKKRLLAFERYIEGYSYSENKKYTKDCETYAELRAENYKKYSKSNNEDEFRQNNLNLKYPQEEKPKYFSLI